MLQRELNRVEDMLSQTRAEKDELGIKLNALSEKVSAPPLSPRLLTCAAASPPLILSFSFSCAHHLPFNYHITIR